jgi:hypothetical protein
MLKLIKIWLFEKLEKKLNHIILALLLYFHCISCGGGGGFDKKTFCVFDAEM